MSGTEQRPVAVRTTTTATGEAWVMKSCVLPTDLYYDVERDLWAREEPGGLVRIGLTDVGQTAGGKIQVVSFPKGSQRIGQHLTEARTVALLESAKWVGPVRLPVAGTLAELNTELLAHPLWVNLEPYGNGWVMAFHPDEPIPWARGEEARLAYATRVGRTFRSVAGVNDDFWCVHCNDWDDL